MQRWRNTKAETRGRSVSFGDLAAADQSFYWTPCEKPHGAVNSAVSRLPGGRKGGVGYVVSKHSV